VRWRKPKSYFTAHPGDNKNQAIARQYMADHGFKFGVKYELRNHKRLDGDQYVAFVMFDRWFGSDDAVGYTYYGITYNKIQTEGWNFWDKFKREFIDSGILISDFEKRTKNVKRSTVLTEILGEHRREISFHIPAESKDFIVLSIGGVTTEMDHKALVSLDTLIQKALEESERREMENLL